MSFLLDSCLDVYYITVKHTETTEGCAIHFYLVAFLFLSELICSFSVYKNLKLLVESVVVYLSK